MIGLRGMEERGGEGREFNYFFLIGSKKKEGERRGGEEKVV